MPTGFGTIGEVGAKGTKGEQRIKGGTSNAHEFKRYYSGILPVKLWKRGKLKRGGDISPLWEKKGVLTRMWLQRNLQQKRGVF